MTITAENGLNNLLFFMLRAKYMIMEKLVHENQKFDYYLPVLKNNQTIGNIVVTVDYQKYF